jgi:hypothetical protein
MAPSTSNNTGLTALAAAASSSAATGTSSGHNMAEDDASLDEMLGINDHHGAPEVQEVAPNKDPIGNSLMKMPMSHNFQYKKQREGSNHI